MSSSAEQPRPTPARPWPQEPDAALPSPHGRAMAPDLGPQAVAVLEGTTFFSSDAAGDVPAGSTGGLVHADTRLLSTWVLTLDGVRLLPLRSGRAEHFAAVFFLTNAATARLRANQVGIRRLRSVGARLRERIEVRSYAGEPLSVQLRLATGADFADLFEIRDSVRDRSAQLTRDHDGGRAALEFAYRNGDFAARTRVEASVPADRVEGDDLVWQLELVDGASWAVELAVPLEFGPTDVVPAEAGFGSLMGAGESGVGAASSPATSGGTGGAAAAGTLGGDSRHAHRGGPIEVATDGSGEVGDVTTRWFAEVPSLHSDSELLCRVGEQTARDLLALRVLLRLGRRLVVLPAAGLPWYLTVFGRDTLITAFLAMSFGPMLARGALLELAALQGTRLDDFRDEEPGKILHEVRQGELTRLGRKPYSPYYGTADATMLWLVLLSEYWRWTGDDELVRWLAPNARAALDWIDRYGDRDGDGYVEYRTRSPQGLGNQCWRDSPDGVQFADGRLPTLPIATCELQGYVYDAKLRLAQLADGPLADPDLAVRLRQQATQLRERFNRDFWRDQRGGYYVLGLDAAKDQIDAKTSNMGHLLWSGIVPDDRAGVVASQLMSPELFSGWGVRTLSTHDSGFNPIGYHIGTVWPHDNALAVLGLTRYGLREEANRIATAQIEAAGHFGHRLPEAFAGFDRTVAQFPVPYPTACSPQAWATAAPLALVRAMLGLHAQDGALQLAPALPAVLGRVRLQGVAAFGTRWDIDATGTTGTITPAQT